MIGTLCRLVPFLRDKEDVLLIKLPDYRSRIAEPKEFISSDFQKSQSGSLLAW
jgi:hypothetical protein